MLQNVLEHLRPTKEPVVYLATLLGVAYLVYQVVFNGQSVVDVLGDNPLEAIVAVLTTVLARQSVYSPRSVEDEVVETFVVNDEL